MTSPAGGVPACLEAARAYLTRGWSIIPIKPSTKEPLLPWKRHTRRRPSEAEGRGWWNRWPEAGVAIICGQVSGLAVLDTDDPVSESLVQAMGLPPTLTARTARGRHRYFRIAGPVQSRRIGGADGGGLELRGDGSYVLAPPSLHPSGLCYAFEDPRAALADLPAALVQLFATKPAPPVGAEVPARWREMLARGYNSALAHWEGRAGGHADQTGSGRDMKLAWFCRKQGFNREETSGIVGHVPYPKEGGRTADYIARTVAKAFEGEGTRPRPRRGFGQLPAWIVTSGLLAGKRRLSHRAVRVLDVLVVRAERPSFIVRISMPRLAAEAGVSPRFVGMATGELAERGVIRKARAGGGRWHFWINMDPPENLTYAKETFAYVSSEKRSGDGAREEAGGGTPWHGDGLGSAARVTPPHHQDLGSPSSGASGQPPNPRPEAPGRRPPSIPVTEEHMGEGNLRIGAPDIGEGFVQVGGAERPREGGGAPWPPTDPCLRCRGTRFWRSVAGVALCSTCHPPAAPALVAAEAGISNGGEG